VHDQQISTTGADGLTSGAELKWNEIEENAESDRDEDCGGGAMSIASIQDELKTPLMQHRVPVKEAGDARIERA
jgi:hypothetical protein